jgi:hypothetical protein
MHSFYNATRALPEDVVTAKASNSLRLIGTSRLLQQTSFADMEISSINEFQRLQGATQAVITASLFQQVVRSTL